MAEEKRFIPKYIRRLISENQMTLTFTKSGNTYRFTPDTVARLEARSFADIENAGTEAVTAALQDALRKLREKDDGDAGRRDPVPEIALEYGTPDDPDDMSAKYAETVFREICGRWKDAPTGESDDYSEPAERIFAESLEDTAYRQDMSKLNLSDRYGVALVADCAGTGPQYFYTDGTYVNGAQIWRKAFNPFIWYGMKTRE